MDCEHWPAAAKAGLRVLNRGGDRQLNKAICTIALRMNRDQATRDYVVHQVATVAGGLRSIWRLTICCQRNRLAAW